MVSKVLFLDVDGVLNNYKTGGIFTVSRSKLKLLQCVVKSTGCIIVLSSTWRLNVMGELDVLKRKFGYRGMVISDTTPKFNGKRGEQIQYWLKQHPEVKAWCIVDDDSDMLDDQSLNFVKTNGMTGMSLQDAEKIIQILGKG